MRTFTRTRMPGLVLALTLGLWASLLDPPDARSAAPVRTYVVVLAGTASDHGFVIESTKLQAALSALENAGAVITADLTRQIGVVIATSADPAYAEVLRDNPLVAQVGEDHAFRVALERPSTSSTMSSPIPAPAPGEDLLEYQQWGMRACRATDARALQMGNPAVDVALLDTGIDAAHQDFFLQGQSNIDLGRGRSFVPSEPSPLIESPPHGTSVAGIIAARKNGVGIVGVAPNVTIVPIKVIDANDNLFASWAVQAITYAGDIQADVINMSWYMDDGDTVFYCKDDPAPRAAREAVK